VWIEIFWGIGIYTENSVTPFAGVWIEIRGASIMRVPYGVTPFAGVWIEMLDGASGRLTVEASLPLRECGLKFGVLCQYCPWNQSLPLRECGLKCQPAAWFRHSIFVTPFAGVWIEI